MRSALSALFALFATVGLASCRPDGSVPDNVFGHCIYENRFSNLEECREFRGDGWTEEDAQASCDEYSVTFAPGACPYENTQPSSS